MGGFGSAIALKEFSQSFSESFTGTLIVQPDRGFNVYALIILSPTAYLFLTIFLPLVPLSDGTVNYQARQHTLSFTLTPYYNDSDLSFSDAQSTLQLTYIETLLYTEREAKNTTGLDALGVRPADGEGAEDPILPIASDEDDRLTLDCEGLVLNQDGT